MRELMLSAWSVPVRFTDQPRKVDIASKVWLRERHSRKFGYDTQRFVTSGPDSVIHTMRSGSAYGSGFSSTAWTTLNIAVFTPMPAASVNTDNAVKPGCFRSQRKP